MTNLTTENTLKKAPFKADHVGSFLRPERLKQARLQKDNGEITAEKLREIENEELQRLSKSRKKPDYKLLQMVNFVVHGGTLISSRDLMVLSFTKRKKAFSLKVSSGKRTVLK